MGDSLFVELPRAVLADSVQVSFTTRVLQNATVFVLDLGASDRPGLWQSVEPAERRSNLVMLPDLPGGSLIGDLSFSTPVLTPNGDGINDEVEVRFVVFKAEGTAPRMEVFDLSGRKVAQMAAQAEGFERIVRWSGRDLAGVVVVPGVYMCRIDLGAQTGEDTVLHPMTVAY